MQERELKRRWTPVSRRRSWGSRFACLAMALAIGLAIAPLSNIAGTSADDKRAIRGTPRLWETPSDIETRNLLLGSGGAEMQPDLNQITLIEKRGGGYSTKYLVRDGAGHEWVVKVGKEAQSETAASRLIWAVGYFTEASYLVPSVNVIGIGTLTNARFEARPKTVKRLGEWKWTDNPFIGTPEFQGLKVMMVLVENWDIKDSNNEMLLVNDKKTGSIVRRYIVSDLGATLGKTGGILSRTRNEPEDYERARFIEGFSNSYVRFKYSGKRQSVFENITVQQATWIGRWLSRLSDEQIKDAFRAANYDQGDIDLLAKGVIHRIKMLTSLSLTPAASIR